MSWEFHSHQEKGTAFHKLKHVASEGQKKNCVNATFVARENFFPRFLAVLKSASIHQLEGNLWIIPNDLKNDNHDSDGDVLNSSSFGMTPKRPKSWRV